jgi:hypothetical protein
LFETLKLFRQLVQVGRFDLCLAQGARILVMHPFFNAFVVEVVPDVAAQWRHLIFFFEYVQADCAIGGTLLLHAAIANFCQRVNDVALYLSSLPMVDKSTPDLIEDTRRKEHQECHNADREECFRQDNNHVNREQNHAVRGVRLITRCREIIVVNHCKSEPPCIQAGNEDISDGLAMVNVSICAPEAKEDASE